VLNKLQDAGNQLRRKLGESLASVQKFDKPLREATTSSLEALKAVSDGEVVRRVKGHHYAIPYFQRAIELDPNFASAYVSLASCYANTNQVSLAQANFRRAFELRSRVSE
jgi:Flp pilus assembly protein TadD